MDVPIYFWYTILVLICLCNTFLWPLRFGWMLQRITWSLFKNDTTWRFWKGNWILRVHMYLLSWRKTNFLCITSILSPKSMSKLINVNCLHFIGCQNYTNVLINRVLYQIQVTALLPFFLSILHLLLQLSKIMLWSTVKLLLAIVMSIIFGPLKTLPRSSKSCDSVTFRVLKYLLSTFLLYTPHCHMIWSKQKCCLWSTGVSTESQNLTSVLHLRQDFLATRNMTRIDVGLARSYVKLLLSSWKTYMCNLMAWYINK